MHIAQVETVDRNFQRKTRSAHNKKNHAFFFHGNNNYNEQDFLTYPLQSICLYREEKTQEQDKQSRTKEAKDLKLLEKAKIGTAVHQRAGCTTGARIRWRGEMCTLQTHEKTSHNSFFLSRRNWTRELRQERCRKIFDRKGEEETFARKVASIHCEFFSSKKNPRLQSLAKELPGSSRQHLADSLGSGILQPSTQTRSGADKETNSGRNGRNLEEEMVFLAKRKLGHN